MTDDVSVATDEAVVSAQLDASDGFRWTIKARVDKFSDEQVETVRQQFGVEEPSGDQLLAMLKPYETVEVPGNLLTTAGLGRLTSLLIGAGGQALTSTATRLGVGNSSSAEVVGQTDLQAAAGAGNRQFKVMDATYPQQAAGVVTAKATFQTGEANFVWNEWCLDIGTPTVADGTTVAAVMLNRKVASLGTKVSGVYALTVTVTIA